MDIYDLEIKYLSENPAQIHKHWEYSTPLFQYVSPEGNLPSLVNDSSCGCLTQIQIGSEAYWSELTEKIRSDDRIPENPYSIREKDLPVFAEWQRKIDNEYGRKPPVEIIVQGMVVDSLDTIG